MNAVLDDILRTGRVQSPSGQLFEAQAHSIAREEGEFLQSLIYKADPTVSLEVGLAYGVSTLFICDALHKRPETRHIVIDPDQHSVWEGIGMRNLQAAGYQELIELHTMPSFRALPQLEAQGLRVDFAFIDGWHTFDYAFVDFYFIDKLLNVGGIVVLDDANWPAIRKLCRYIATNHAYTPICMADAPDRRISRKKRLLNMAMRFPYLSRKLPTTLRSELIETDARLGLWGACIAFLKESEDTRRWDFYQRF